MRSHAEEFFRLISSFCLGLGESFWERKILRAFGRGKDWSDMKSHRRDSSRRKRDSPFLPFSQLLTESEGIKFWEEGNKERRFDQEVEVGLSQTRFSIL